MRVKELVVGLGIGLVAAFAFTRFEAVPKGRVAWNPLGCYSIASGTRSKWRPLFMLERAPAFTDSATSQFAFVRDVDDGFGNDWGVTFVRADSVSSNPGQSDWIQLDSATVLLKYFDVDWGYSMTLSRMSKDTIDGIVSFEAFPAPYRGRVKLLPISCQTGFHSTSSGLSFRTLRAGHGDDTAAVGMDVTINERTSLMDGTQLFSTYDTKTPITFRLGANQVIKGVEEGVIGMRVGEWKRLIVPKSLSARSSYPPNTPPDSTLRIDVTLVKLSRPQ